MTRNDPAINYDSLPDRPLRLEEVFDLADSVEDTHGDRDFVPLTISRRDGDYVATTIAYVRHTDGRYLTVGWEPADDRWVRVDGGGGVDVIGLEPVQMDAEEWVDEHYGAPGVELTPDPDVKTEATPQ